VGELVEVTIDKRWVIKMNAERVGGFFWLAFGLAVMIGSLQLGLGSLQAPGSGFLGFLAGAFVLLMAVIVLVQSFLNRDTQEKMSALWKELRWRRPLTVVFLVFAYNLALERLGFMTSSILFMLVMFKWVEKFSWQKAILVTFAVVVGSYLLFHTFLKASLPQGILGF
jgi:putative tricarboxylic transport membrane protein